MRPLAVGLLPLALPRLGAGDAAADAAWAFMDPVRAGAGRPDGELARETVGDVARDAAGDPAVEPASVFCRFLYGPRLLAVARVM